MASDGPRVVNVRACVPGAVYIGRRARHYARGWLPESPFANPFRIGAHGTRGEVIEKYRHWLWSQPSLIDRARMELRGKVLECWCSPLPCHGDVLLEVANDGDGAESSVTQHCATCAEAVREAVAREREACAALCDESGVEHGQLALAMPEASAQRVCVEFGEALCADLAALIRARGGGNG